MEIEQITTKKAPKAIGPYSQAIKANGFMYISGQLPLKMPSMEVLNGKASEQAELVLTHIQAILEAAGLTMRHVIKTELFLANMDDFKEVNEVYGRFFSNAPCPARHAFAVDKLPLDVKVEISCVAVC